MLLRPLTLISKAETAKIKRAPLYYRLIGREGLGRLSWVLKRSWDFTLNGTVDARIHMVNQAGT